MSRDEASETAMVGPNWSGPLRPDTIGRVVARFRDIFADRRFTIASFLDVERTGSDPRIEVTTGCTFEPNWTDGSREPVRLWMDTKSLDGDRTLAPHFSFSAGHYHWSFWADPPMEGKKEGYPDYGVPHFNFNGDKVEIRDRAPAGNLNVYVFVVERERGD